MKDSADSQKGSKQKIVAGKNYLHSDTFVFVGDLDLDSVSTIRTIKFLISVHHESRYWLTRHQYHPNHPSPHPE